MANKTATAESRERRKKTSLIKKARWAGYAAAGAATAVVAQETAEAGDIYDYVNPADIVIQAPGGGSSTAYGTLDLNGDGVNDFFFSHRVNSAGTLGIAAINTLSNAYANSTYGYNEIAGATMSAGIGSFQYASNLPPGAMISAGLPGLLTYYGYLAFNSGYANSQFLAPGPGIIGVRFNSAAGTHNGWIRVNMTGANVNGITVTDWAYGMPGETILAGQIPVPEPGSLGLLAAGAAGLLVWRRKRTQDVVATEASS
jgi:hypothetical protein